MGTSLAFGTSLWPADAQLIFSLRIYWSLMAPGRCPRTLCWSNRKGNRPTPKRPWVGLKPTTSSTNQILLEVNERQWTFVGKPFLGHILRPLAAVHFVSRAVFVFCLEAGLRPRDRKLTNT